MDEIAALIKQQCKEDVNLIVGHTIDNIGEGVIRVSLLASGINNNHFLKILIVITTWKFQIDFIKTKTCF